MADNMNKRFAEEPGIETQSVAFDWMQSEGARIRKKNRLAPGTILNGKWEILRHIGSGGKGDVYVASQKVLNRNVAVKVFSPGLEGAESFIQEEIKVERERFRREIVAMAGIRHPNVIHIYDHGDDIQLGRQLEFLVMELVSGSTLRSSMSSQGFGFDRMETVKWIQAFFLPVLEGMKAVHNAGIIHRDIKPENILLDGPVPKIADFGSARLPRHQGITRSFHILGTLFYMPEEQFEDGSLADASTDVYALGKLLYEAILGKKANNSKLVFKQVYLPLHEHGFGKDGFFTRLDAIIMNATAKRPEERTASVEGLQRSLADLVSPAHS